MASAFNIDLPKSVPDGVTDSSPSELRTRQQCIAEITEMIHVASLLHDDVLDDAETRRGIGSLNYIMGNKLAVLAGDFLLSRACVALASLKNTEVVSLLAKVVEHLVTGETMQMTTTSDERCSMEYYMQKTFYKTASLISNSCKAIAILTGQTAEVSMMAYEYGRNLGLAFQLIDDVLDFTGTSASLGKGSLSDIRH
ncbi:Geranyl diphosphate synthase, partial [Thalictrum thalictroides]